MRRFDRNERLGYYAFWREIGTRALRMRGRLVRWLPPRNAPHFFTDNPNRTHANGYEIAKLGPPKLVAKERELRP